MLALDSNDPCELLTADVERLTDFWQRALDLTADRDRTDATELTDQDRSVCFVIRRTTPPTAPAHVRLSAFDTQDVVAAVERLVALGASSPERPYPSVPGRAVVIDPDGNTVEITARIGSPE